MKRVNLQAVSSALLISSSSVSGEGFLQNSISHIEEMLRGVSSLCFIPHAAVTVTFDDYVRRVRLALSHLDIEVLSLHTHPDSIYSAEAICVGGGNSFALLHRLQQMSLLEVIARRVSEGVPYIGWSAGSNIAAPTISTTNDMPIVEPQSFNALNIVPFQINPHYTDLRIEGHCGESREDRIMEYITMNPSRYVVALREGSALMVRGEKLELLGDKSMRLFKYGEAARELSPRESIDFLM